MKSKIYFALLSALWIFSCKKDEKTSPQNSKKFNKIINSQKNELFLTSEIDYKTFKVKRIGELLITRTKDKNNDKTYITVEINGKKTEKYFLSETIGIDEKHYSFYNTIGTLEMKVIKKGKGYKTQIYNCETCSFPSSLSTPSVDWCLLYPSFCTPEYSNGNGNSNQEDTDAFILEGGGGNLDFNLIQNQVLQNLSLTVEQSNFINSQPGFLLQIYYLGTNNLSEQEKDKLVKHIDEMRGNVKYYNLVTKHFQTAANTAILWWNDINWLDNSNNFTFDIDAHNGQPPYTKLTAAEKLLVAKYPTNAARINANVSTAYSFTIQKFGTQGLNDKSDAFRHAFFSAINARDCVGDAFTLKSNTDIVRMFGEAHESEVPTALTLEKQMDLFNNDIGIAHCAWCVNTINTSESIADSIKIKVDNGVTKYLKPLNFTLSPRYDANGDGIQDCASCLNGIVLNGNNPTILVNTNQ